MYLDNTRRAVITSPDLFVWPLASPVIQNWTVLACWDMNSVTESENRQSKSTEDCAGTKGFFFFLADHFRNYLMTCLNSPSGKKKSMLSSRVCA